MRRPLVIAACVAVLSGVALVRMDTSLAMWLISLELVPIALVRPRLLPQRDHLSRYLVGWDIRPGRYLLTAVDGAAYFARRDLDGEVVENGFSASALSVTVDSSDWMLQFSGELTPA